MGGGVHGEAIADSCLVQSVSLGSWFCFVLMQNVITGGWNWHRGWLPQQILVSFSRNFGSVPKLNQQNWWWFQVFLPVMWASQNHHPKPMFSVHSSHQLKNSRQPKASKIFSVWNCSTGLLRPIQGSSPISANLKRPCEGPSKAIVFFKQSEKTKMFAMKTGVSKSPFCCSSPLRIPKVIRPSKTSFAWPTFSRH